MHPTIDDRLLLILKEAGGRPDGFSVYQKEKGAQLAYKGFWLRMEELTGIKAGRWRSYFSGQQKAATDMIEAVARMWPQYAFWLATGITDAANGHTAPMTAVAFPERLYAEHLITNDYFKRSLDLLNTVLASTSSRSALERNRVLGKWLGGKVVEAAYELCESDEYRQLQETWAAREKDRNKHLARITGSHRPWLKQMDGSPKIKNPAVPKDARASHQDNWDLFYKPKAEGE